MKKKNSLFNGRKKNFKYIDKMLRKIRLEKIR